MNHKTLISLGILSMISLYGCHEYEESLRLPNGAICERNYDCETLYCNDSHLCAGRPDGEKCIRSSDCASAVCNAYGICESPVCKNDAMCSDGYICVDGVCIHDSLCYSSANCQAGYECIAGECVKEDPCHLGMECPGDMICVDGKCIKEQSCYFSTDCQAGYECIEGECIEEGHCNTDAMCMPGYICVHGLCVESSAECSADSDCLTGTCYEGKCISQVLGCLEDSDCSFGYCREFECVASCRIDSECAPGFVCSNDLCVTDGFTCIDPSRDQIKVNEGLYDEIILSKLNSADYYTGAGSSAVFSDRYHKVTGFFGASTIKSASQVLSAAGFVGGTCVEESHFNSTVPSQSWSDHGFDAKAHQMADFNVVRTKYTINMSDGDTLESLAHKFGLVFGVINSGFITERSCDGNKAILYLAQATYPDKNGIQDIYSGALTCAKTRENSSVNTSVHFNDVETMNIMDDVISGSLATFKVVKNESYESRSMMTCEKMRFSDFVRAVDFLWVVDNSGSMGDELENITKTSGLFVNKLEESGIDYRIAVTTTDSYVIDEKGIIDYVSFSHYPYNKDYTTVMEGLPVSDSYMNMLGIRMPVSALSPSAVPGFMDRPEQIYKNGEETLFSKSITSNKYCGADGKNLCGIGIEDGFKSGVYTLSRLAIDIQEKDPNKNGKNLLSREDQKIFDQLVDVKKYISKGIYLTGTKNDNDEKLTTSRISLRNDALKYIIWISDENSRQFKEVQAFTPCMFDDCSSFEHACLTGYKVNNGTMRTGRLTSQDTDETKVCSPTMTALDDAIAKNFEDVKKDKTGKTKLLQDRSLKELRADRNLSDYVEILDYYLKEYRKYAGTGGISGFAIVGDMGVRNGGACRPLKGCRGICYVDANDNVGHESLYESGCYECDGEWVSDAAAIDGADYGLPYIHLARFLSLDDKGNGQEGGFASICNNDYDTTINAIMEDVTGRTIGMGLKDFPISSTIKFSVYKKDAPEDSKVLTRGAQKNGFVYNYTQNTIILKNVSELVKAGYDQFSISYASWSRE